MKIAITYCAQWNYLPKASSLGDALAHACNADIELIAGSGGVLEVLVDGVEIFSKKKSGHFPTSQELIALIHRLWREREHSLMNNQVTAAISLSLLDGKGSVIKTWPLTDKKTYRIGRGQANDILLDNSWVSRQHAMLQVEENGTVYALDMGSANGTLVNGQRIVTPTPLRSGDLIQIGGKSTLTFLQNYTVEIAPGVSEDEERTVALVTRTQVTVLICDIRRFTTLSEKIGDQKVSDIVRRWSQKTNEMVAAHHGRIDKFIGDAAMAIWAEGTSLRHTVHQALTCASRIAAMTTELSNRIPDLPWPLTIGAALNTGEALIGNIGVDGNRDYTVIGDTVNVAFRLEGLTSKLGVDLLIGNDTAALLDQRVIATYFSPCTSLVKGKSTPVVAHGCTFERLQQYLTQQKVNG